MERERVASILDEIGTLLEIRGENPFRCRAYRNASQAIKTVEEPLNDLVASGRLKDVPGLGAAMVEKVTRLVTTGGLVEYDDLKRETPPGLIALLRVPAVIVAYHFGYGIGSIAGWWDALRGRPGRERFARLTR